MDEPDDLAPIKTPWWKKMNGFHWLILSLAVLFLVIWIISSTQSGIRDLFPSQESRLPEFSRDAGQAGAAAQAPMPASLSDRSR